jgi:hypothetical protein
MRQKLLTVLAFASLIAAGALAAGAVAGKGPSSVQQTVSSTTGSTTASTTTGTTTTVSTTTTTTTTTTPAPRKITICHHARTKKGFVKHVTIRINRTTWPGHKKHGDSIGACNTAYAKKFHSRPTHIKKFHRRHK